jgi:acetyl/propionyl-CoA carboxylase alpha subunit/acetyl-CoA carboxylase carboxyltransferase component
MHDQRPILPATARIAIVNRGEAALRFIRAVREFNSLYHTELTTVAFYLDMEREALFVKEADVVWPLAALPNFAANTGIAYSDKSLMCDAVAAAKCQAVWAGWGFLSENAQFVEMLEAKGLVFLGPPAKAMSLLGDKIAAKAIAKEAGVPILPWSEGPVKDLDAARQIAETIGYPVIVKAAHAGGGRGIRFVKKPEELARKYQSAREETLRITGDDILFIEHLVEKARHLEVQTAADRHGHVLTFGVRDCSIQRRNQKVIEETPPCHLPQEMIAELEGYAARLLTAAGYESVGTVEFIYDMALNRPYFMEVNTRLQVEHPITELVYGIDLVKIQLQVALGQELTAELKPTPRGCAIEVRLNAEDAEKEFVPAPGKVVVCKMPSGPGIRVDSGIEEGSTIPKEFDSMVAKIIAYAPTRTETIARLERALGETRIKIEGGVTNRAFLLQLLSHPQICAGEVHTHFVEELLAAKVTTIEKRDWDVALTACAIEQCAAQHVKEVVNFREQLGGLSYPRDIPASSGYKITLHHEGNPYQFLVKAVGNNIFHLTVANQEFSVQYLWRGQEAMLIGARERFAVQTVMRGDVLQCEINGIPYPLALESCGLVRSPSPAIVLAIAVAPGQSVKAGDLLVTLEAMKMEIIVAAPQSGTVKNVAVKKGQQVAAGQSLVEVDSKKAVVTEKTTIVSKPPITFERLQNHDLTHCWAGSEREFLAVFLGYDYSESPSRLLGKMLNLVKQNPALTPSLAQAFIAALEIYVAGESLFSAEKFHAVGFAHAVSGQELLLHMFRRKGEAQKGVPPQFLAKLERATQWYRLEEAASDEARSRALFRIYKAHAQLKSKQELLRAVLLAMEESLFGLSGPLPPKLADLLDETTRLAQLQAPWLADSALHARHFFLDRAVLRQVAEERRARLQKLVAWACTGIIAPEADKLRQQISDAGHEVVDDLLALALAEETASRTLAIELLARYFNRDRQWQGGELLQHEACICYRAVSRQGEENCETLVVVTEAKDLPRLLGILANVFLPKNGKAELILLLSLSGQDKEDEVFQTIAQAAATLPVCWCAVGVAQRGSRFVYRTFTPDGQEDGLRRGFSPLAFRELRVHRLVNFHTEIVQQTDAVTVVRAVAKANSKDERLFALVDVAEANPEFRENGAIHRIVAFEYAFMEAVHAMRSQQIQRGGRLFWNRIIVHVRSFLHTNLQQIRDYAVWLAPRTFGLGIERVVLYTRTEESEGAQETELIFENTSGYQFSLRGRKPSLKPLEPLDAYTAKIVRARQVGTIFPYEIIKMITKGRLGSVQFPQSEFAEYDIRVKAETGETETLCVQERPYGQNSSNIVFGLITNFSQTHPYGLKRVLILSDPTVDMGALAEPECRRVIAALDLAESLSLPVEWLPISSGAKIDMESGTENLDWTAATLRRIVTFTQKGGEINIIVAGTNVGAQSYWNAEATMLMHSKGCLIMTEDAAMLLTGKKALDFSGSVSAEDSVGIGGLPRIMGPNGEAQLGAADMAAAYALLLRHYDFTYARPGRIFPDRQKTSDPYDRNICLTPYNDFLGQGFRTLGDIFSKEHNPERKKPFDMRQVMQSVGDQDWGFFERWQVMQDAQTAIVWEARIGGFGVGLFGIESRPLTRLGAIPGDGPQFWNAGTLFPLASKKIAHAINSFSRRLPVVILANLSGFDGSPESLRNCQLEFGAEIGRAVVNFEGPIIFVVLGRYHGGAYVVFSRTLNPQIRAVALEGAFASVIGGAPAAAVVFPKMVLKDTESDPRVIEAKKRLKEDGSSRQKDYDELFQVVYAEKQAALAQRFDAIHSVARAKKVGSLHDVIPASQLRPYLIEVLSSTYGNRP